MLLSPRNRLESLCPLYEPLKEVFLDNYTIDILKANYPLLPSKLWLARIEAQHVLTSFASA